MTDNDCIIRSTPNAQRHNYFLKFLAVIFKMIISVILSLIILTMFTNFYNGLPPAIFNSDGATDLHYPSNERFICAVEGFTSGKFNNEGYNNLFDYETEMNIDVLLMGASHMQAFQVMPCDNTAGVLGKLSQKIVYNIGVNAHDFAICASNLEAAVKKYKPSEYVIVENLEVSYSDERLNEILSYTVPKKNTFLKESLTAGGLRTFYTKHLRSFVHKYFFTLSSTLVYNFKSIFRLFPKSENKTKFSHMSSKNHELLSQVLKRMAETVKNFSRGAKLIIAYHPTVALKDDGSLKILENPEAVKIFADACEQNGIYFLDLSERFLEEYQKNYTLPTGFFNTSIASGHMNKDGHRMFAEEIYKLMQKIEGVNN